MSAWEFAGDADADPDAVAPTSGNGDTARAGDGSSGNGADTTEAGEPAGSAGSPATPPPVFRDPDPHERVPGLHVAYSAQTQWCRACTGHYGAPILWPCSTYDYQQDRERFDREARSGPADSSGAER